MVWSACGAAGAEPEEIAAGDLWYNGQVIKHCTGTDPEVFTPLTTFYADDVKNGYGFFTTEPVRLEEDAGRVSVTGIKLDGAASSTRPAPRAMLPTTASSCCIATARPRWHNARFSP